MTDETIRQGGCLCGAIRYQVAGEPVRTSICHCTQCRRQTGSALPAFAIFPERAFRLERGVPAGFAASARAVRQFCPSCGSPLFWREHGGAEVEIFLGSFDEPASLPAPSRQIWTVHRLAWVATVAGIPAWPEQGD
jgi:hypothetical protein